MKTKKLVFASIFIALVFVATSTIKFPISFGFGYIHLGDTVVMLAGMLLGPVYGAISAALGSALADYAGGYAMYMIPTFLVKGLLAFAVGLAYKNLKEITVTKVIYHAVAGLIIVVGGYFIADLVLATFVIGDLEGSTPMAYAAFGLPWNAVQVSFGTLISLILYAPLKKPFENMYK